MADNVNVMQTEVGPKWASAKASQRSKKLFENPERGAVAHTPRRRAAPVHTMRKSRREPQEYILHVCPGAEWRTWVKRTLLCGAARRSGISRTTNVLYVLNSLLPPHSDERQETRGTGQETRSAQIASVRPTQCCRREASKKKSTQSSRSWTSQDVELSLSVSPEAQRRPSQ